MIDRKFASLLLLTAIIIMLAIPIVKERQRWAMPILAIFIISWFGWAGYLLVRASKSNYRYNPFGGTISSSGTLASANTYRFSSKEFHSNSGLYYYGYRWYDPNLQRWLNRDPIFEEGGINLYSFVMNQPI